MRSISQMLTILILVCSKSFALATEPGPELFLQTGHTDLVTSVALSSDGKYVLTGSEDGTAILREAASGKILQTFQGETYQGNLGGGYRGGVTCVALSGNGRHVVTGSLDRATLWEVTGKKLYSFAHVGIVTSVAISADGKHVLTGSRVSTGRPRVATGTAILWEANSGKQLQTFTHTHPVTSVALSRDGKHVLTGSEDHTAVLWEAGGEKLRTFQHTDAVMSVALSSDGKRLLTGQSVSITRPRVDTPTVVLWEAASGKVLQQFEGYTSSVTSVALSGEVKRILAGSLDGTATLWDAAGKKLQTFKHTDAIKGVALSSDGTRVLTGSDDRTAILWDADGTRVQTFQGHTASVTSVALSGDGQHLLAGSEDGTAILWDVAAGKKVQTFVHTAAVLSVALSGDGKRALTGTGTRDMKLRDESGGAILWDAVSGKQLQTHRSRTSVRHLALSRDGTRLVTASGHMVILWDAISGKQLRTFESGSFVSQAVLSGDGKHVLTGSGESEAILWEADSGRKLQTFRDRTFRGGSSALPVTLSGDGKNVITGTPGGAILWEAGRGRQLQIFNGYGPSRVAAVSEDGKLVVTGASPLYLYDAVSGKQLQSFQGHTARVTAVALSGDGTYLWSASDDHSTRLWHLATGKERCRLFSLDAGKDWLVITPEGLFDGSEGAWRFVSYRDPSTGKPIEDDATRRRLHRPGLLAKLWKELKGERDEILRKVILKELRYRKDRDPDRKQERGYEAYFVNPENKEAAVLSLDILPEEFDVPEKWTIKDRSGREVARVKMLLLDREQIYFESGKKVYRMKPGQNLHEVLARPLTDVEVKALKFKRP